MSIFIPFSIGAQQIDSQFIDPNGAILELNELIEHKQINTALVEETLIKLLSQNPYRISRFEEYASPQVKEIMKASDVIQRLKEKMLQESKEAARTVERKLVVCPIQTIRFGN